MSKKFDCEIFTSTMLKLTSHRHHRIECSVSRLENGIHSISIGNTDGWCHRFCTGMIGDDCVKVNNCLCWKESDGRFRAVYIDSFYKFGEIILYATAYHSSAQKSSLYALESWRNAREEIIKIVDKELDNNNL